MILWLHCSPDGVVVSTSFTPSGAPADMQNAVISPQALPLRAASTRTTRVGFIGLSEDYRAAALYDMGSREGDFVQALYRQLLGRVASAAEVAAEERNHIGRSIR